MAIYNLTEEGSNKIRKGIYWLAGIILFLTIATTLTLMYFKDQEKEHVGYSIAITGIIVSIAFLFLRKKIIERIDNSFGAIEVEIDEERISRRMGNYPEITIYKDQITKITETKRGTISVQTKDWKTKIGIPKYIENREELREQINKFKEIQFSNNMWVTWLIIAGGLLFIAGFIIFMTTENRLVVSSIGIGMIALSIFNMIILNTTPNANKKTKRAAWGYLLIIVIIAGRLLLINEIIEPF